MAVRGEDGDPKMIPIPNPHCYGTFPYHPHPPPPPPPPPFLIYPHHHQQYHYRYQQQRQPLPYHPIAVGHHHQQQPPPFLIYPQHQQQHYKQQQQPLPYHAIPGGHHHQQQQPPPLPIYPQHQQQPLPYHATPVGHQPLPYPGVAQHDIHVTESKLPFCGLGLGWTLFLAGFVLAIIPWYIGFFILLFVAVDNRVKPGLIACTFAAALVTMPLILEPFSEFFR